MRPSEATTTVAVLLARLQEYYRGNQSITVDGVRFAERFQRPGERFDEFRFAVDELAKDVELCEHCEDRRLREQLVLGLRGQEVKRELLRHKALTLDVVVDICRSYEAAAADAVVGVRDGRHGYGGGRALADEGVDAIRTAYKERQRDTVAARTGQVPAAVPQSSARCRYCTNREHPRSQCPARDAVCHGCGEKGHFRPRCPRARASSAGPGTGANR